MAEKKRPWPASILGKLGPNVYNRDTRTEPGFKNKVRRNRITWNIKTLDLFKDEALDEGHTDSRFYDKIARGKHHWSQIMKLLDDDDK
jgi:hypothetical protein